MQVQLRAKTVGDYPKLGLVHLAAFIFPECLPERLPLLTRFLDFTPLNDGILYLCITEVEDVH